jgi:hypothetical protein
MPSKCSRKKRSTCKKPCTWRRGTYNKRTGKRTRKPSCAKPPKKMARKSSCSKKKRKTCKTPCTWRRGVYTKSGKRVRKPSCAKPPGRSRKPTSRRSRKTTRKRVHKPSSTCNANRLKRDCKSPCQWRKASYKNGKRVRRGYCASPGRTPPSKRVNGQALVLPKLAYDALDGRVAIPVVDNTAGFNENIPITRSTLRKGMFTIRVLGYSRRLRVQTFVGKNLEQLDSYLAYFSNAQKQAFRDYAQNQQKKPNFTGVLPFVLIVQVGDQIYNDLYPMRTN